MVQQKPISKTIELIEPIRRTWIYVAGPMSKGDYIANIRQGIFAATLLLESGFVPICPHLSAFWHLLTPQGYETWLAMDLEYISRCDYLLRIPGESAGADREVAFAQSRNIPVIHVGTLPLDHYIRGIKATR